MDLFSDLFDYFCKQNTTLCDQPKKFDFFRPESDVCSSEQSIRLSQYAKSVGVYYKLPDYKINPFAMLRFVLDEESYDVSSFRVGNIPNFVMVRHSAIKLRYNRKIICFDKKIQQLEYITEQETLYEFVNNQEYSIGFLDDENNTHYYHESDIGSFFAKLSENDPSVFEFAAVRQDMNPFIPDPSEIWKMMNTTRDHSTLDKVSETWTRTHLEQYRDHQINNTQAMQHNILYKSESIDKSFSLLNPVIPMWVQIYEANISRSLTLSFVSKETYKSTFDRYNGIEVVWVSGEYDDENDTLDSESHDDAPQEPEPIEEKQPLNMSEIITNSKYMNVDQYRSRKNTGTLTNPATQSELDIAKAKKYKHLLIESVACRAGNDVLHNNNSLMTYDSIHVKNTSITTALPLIDTLYLSSCIVQMAYIGLVKHLYATNSVLHGSLLQQVKSIVFDRVNLDDLQISTEDVNQFDLQYVHISNCRITSTQVEGLYNLMKSGNFIVANCHINGSRISVTSESIHIDMKSNTYTQ